MKQLLVPFILCLTVTFISADSDICIRENSFQTDRPIIRAERPFKLEAFIDHDNAICHECYLEVPESCKILGSSNKTSKEGTLETFDVVCNMPGQVTFSLYLNVGGKLMQKSTIMQAVLPPKKIEKLDYIPEPQPVKTEMLVGAHNCPLWETDRAELWNQVVKKHQERTPALGIYSQDNPELADWETKWAVEHGVSFFIYCWYRTSQGGPITTMFEQSIFDDAFFKSRFEKKMKFTIMWENQRRGFAGISDMEDLEQNLMPYWIEKFFKRENYLKIDNKPVLFVYQPHDVARDLGGDDKAKIAFDRMREIAKEAGFDGLYILGEYRGTDANHLQRYKTMGLDYVFAYCWYVPNSPPPAVVIEEQMKQIKARQDQREILPQIVTLSQAWSGWKDEGTIWKLPPVDFEILLRRGKEYIEKNIPNNELGSKMLILDNWNEWSEGHYIAPYREYGFGYLDAVRRVFSNATEDCVDLIPEDIGLGPYDLPKSLFGNCTSWTFRGNDYDNWKRQFSPSQDWRAMMNVKNLQNIGQCLTFETTSSDPAIVVRQDRTRATHFDQMVVRMKTSIAQEDTIQLFWMSEQNPQFSVEHSCSVKVKPSSDFMEYVFPLKDVPGWKGRITELRIDPVETEGVFVEIEHVRLDSR